MSTIAGMYYMRTPGTTAQDIQPSECSVMDSETNLNLSEDDNTSCSASDMGCDLSLPGSNGKTTSSKRNSGSASSRKNKRKNFKPRNILEYAGSDEEDENNLAIKLRNLQKLNKHNLQQRQSQHAAAALQFARRKMKLAGRNNEIDQDGDHDDDDIDDNEDDEIPPSPSDSLGDADELHKFNGISSRDDDDPEVDIDMPRGDRTNEDSDEEDSDYHHTMYNRAVLRGGGDGPLDLSEVQNDSSNKSSPSWPRSKPKLPLSLINNLNNNVNDPSSFLSHQVAAAAAAAAVNNIPLGLASSLGGGMGMDLRMSSSRNPGDLYEESPSNDQLITSSTNNANSILNNIHNSNNNNNITHNNNNSINNHHNPHHQHVSSPHQHHHLPGAAVLNDFAENTMKELLSLYGITENFRQAGGKASSEMLNIHGQMDTPPGHQAKMMLPENMARLLAAMQESVASAAASANAADHSTQSSQSSSVTSSPKVNHHPLNFANISSLVQQPLVTSAGSPIRSPSSNGGHNSMNNHLGSTRDSNSSGVNGHLFSQKQKNRSAGRGLTSFPVIREGLLGKGTGPVDYTRYVRRFSNSMECGHPQCRELNYREHFHCQECSDGSRVFVKKEEMIRHFKWHKKRDESLQHGFMRYSPMDDCSDKFPNCSHNRKQTHYHCLKDACEKVYISTSDVQMHANYHRKDSAIIQEGFQRFRAAEDCGTDHCTFRHQKTTHFHCRRPTCSFTFKNKADMEKHKSYHIKDEQLNRDGFKKFMKHEECQYPSCRFSRVCNHIHCIREGCNYVLHSSGQLYSHKRKHERRDAELAYRKYKLAQSLMKGNFGTDFASFTLNDALLATKDEEENSRSSLNEETELETEDVTKKFIQLCNCDLTSQEHFHCKVDSCLNALLGSGEVAAEHSKNHELEDKISSLAYFTVDPANFDAQDSTIPCISAKCPYQTREKHFHCLWDGCTEIILATDESFARLEHFRAHQQSQKLDDSGVKDAEAMDGFFRRKRGRPPKNRVIEVSSGANEAIYTSFKLPKPSILGNGGDGVDILDSDSKDPIGFVSYPDGSSCPDASCPYNQTSSTCHYHCGHPRCHFSVADVHKLSNHLREFHTSCDVLEGFEYYDRNSNCQTSRCEFNGSSNHFHCTRDNFICMKHLEMVLHETECHEGKSISSSDDESESKRQGAQVVKASGTFYPTYSFDKTKINGNGGNAMDLSSSNGVAESPESKSITDHSLSRILQIPVNENGETQYGPEIACGRPFCKLKRKLHFHCHLCNQAFSELEKLRPHVLKHSHVSPAKLPESDPSTDEDSVKNEEDATDQIEKDKRNEEAFRKFEIGMNIPANHFAQNSISNFLGYPAHHSPYLFLQQNPLIYAGMMFGSSAGGVFPHGPVLPNHPPTSSPHLAVPPPALAPINEPISLTNSPVLCNTSGAKRPPSASPSSPASPSEAKKARMQMRILKDEPVPEGYIRFRFNEDCAYIHCGYREHQTHFHCTREDCGYSFCDKTRFVQHTARHERLDTLMGGDFKQFRANVSCGRPDCAYKTPAGATQAQNKASHFHCSKCEFVCTDTNKVVAHRRQHQKLDSIMAAGFEKFTPSQHCQIDGCIHSQKQTHYHCLKCGYAVLGLSQMSAHKYRHVD